MKILVHSMDGTGHIGACVGLAQTLRSCGHDVLFAINEDLAGNCSRFDFREILLRKAKKDQNNNKTDSGEKIEKEDMARLFGKQLMESGLLSGRSSLEKLACLSPEQEDSNANYVKTLYDLLIQFIPQLQKIIADEKPSCMILDHFLLPPFLAEGKLPWVFLYSGNPLPLFHDPKLPPPNSGYALPRKPDEDWEEFNRQLGKHFYRSFYDYQMKLNDHFNYKPSSVPSPDQFGIQSPFLNIYQYPEELDYYTEQQMPANFFRVDAFARDEVQKFTIPEKLLSNKSADSKLIYLSLGSMGGYDIDLMKRITSVLAKTHHKIIVSKGPRGDEYELPDNCWGANFLPQPNILPLCDLVISHGGNNTVTEAFALGKPMIILSLFSDQYDNRVQLDSRAFGTWLDTYAFTDEQMFDAIERLLNDKQLNEKLAQISKKIATANRKLKACERIQNLVEKNAE